MQAWFSTEDVVELERLGYNLYEFEISDRWVVSEFETVFTRDSIISVRVMEPSDIWPDYKSTAHKMGTSFGEAACLE